MDWLSGLFKGTTVGGVISNLGDLGGYIVKAVKTYLMKAAAIAFTVMLIINVATFISNFLGSIQLQIGTTAPESVRFMLDLIFAVAPPNFQSSISLVMSIALTKVGLRFYVLIIGKFTSDIKYVID